MVSIQGDEFVLEAEVTSAAPQLQLVDFSKVSARRRRSQRMASKKFENRLFALTLGAVVLFFVVSGATSILNLGSSLAAASQLAAAPTETVVVQQGDTLWRIASRYGDSSQYILDRVEAISRINHLSGDQPLVAGQKILVPIHAKDAY
jgi:LysM repeat protein